MGGRLDHGDPGCSLDAFGQRQRKGRLAQTLRIGFVNYSRYRQSYYRRSCGRENLRPNRRARRFGDRCKLILLGKA